VDRDGLPARRDGASVVYCSDTAPFSDILLEHEFIAKPPTGEPLPKAIADKLAAMRASLVALCQGADLLIYDTQFTDRRVQAAPALGPLDARRRDRDRPRGAGQDALPVPPRADASDEAQDAILMAARWSAKSHGDGFNVIAAHEGLELTLGDDDPAAVVTP
jgi:hypothetical protein